MQHNYTGWGLYNDPRDPRLIVPKMRPAFGWTLNIAHRRSRVMLAVIGVTLAAAITGAVLAS